ncbi:hypothetical protein NLG97_g8301 [Lecanicillium saksenae]|uniref:Uncharacterized protein n=1 Tax=Lecanicillium saksenae TaxID=468837 RepID=A0ACC1QJD8_9HYPO|nr:hypothetical protein NLG97_g8301 [Lecanicillium saksenae]
MILFALHGSRQDALSLFDCELLEQPREFVGVDRLSLLLILLGHRIPGLDFLYELFEFADEGLTLMCSAIAS